MRMRATKFLASPPDAAIAIAIVVMSLGALLMPAPALAQTACPPTINACGCAITSRRQL